MPFFRRKKHQPTDLLGFDRHYYLANNPDVASSGVDPVWHYMEYGWREGRDPSAHFSTAGYLRDNPDVAQAEINPLVHFLNYGLIEGRVIGPLRDEITSLRQQLAERNVPDLRPDSVEALRVVDALQRVSLMIDQISRSIANRRAIERH